MDHRLKQVGGDEDRSTHGFCAADYVFLVCRDLFKRHLP